MDLKLIRNLVRLMERGELSELEIEDQSAQLRVHPAGAAPTGAPVMMVPPPTAAPVMPMAMEAPGAHGRPGGGQSPRWRG
ncbi:MAG: hypothetical protein R3F17_05570 [Planctomycetota bacterium]